MLADEDKPRIFQPALIHAPLLIDGLVGGRWKVETSTRKAELHVTCFCKRRPEDRKAVEAEASALLHFLAPKTQTRRIRVTA